MSTCKTIALTAAIVIYAIGALLTNAYCQVHRWDDWQAAYEADQDRRYYPSECPTASTRVTGATLAWPIYWAYRGAERIVTPR